VAGWRAALSLLLLLPVPVLIAVRDPGVLAAALAAAAAARLAVDRRPRPLLMLLIPLAWFLSALLALQWIAGRLDPALPLRTAAIVLLTATAFRAAPWKSIAGALSPRSPFYMLGLYLLFVRHFAAILAGETWRTLRTRAMNAPSLFRRGGASSLLWAMASIVRRTLDRAERFYAAQLLKGLAA